MTELSRARWREVEPLLDAALDLPTAARSAFLDRACAADAALRDAVGGVLAACDRGDAMLVTPAGVTYASLLAAPTVALPALLGGRYQVGREIGRGGMATVYLADDLRHDRQVAVKVLRPDVAWLIGCDRFRRETEVAARLVHPHILPLYDSGAVPADGVDPGGGWELPYYVSPFVAGGSLRDRLRRDARLAPGEAARVAGEVALALHYAHRQGVVHLDVKPDNILLHAGRAVLADFGIARSTRRTAAGGRGEAAAAAPLLGTPSYMSPEQASGGADVDGRSDVYSLGCVLYECVTGERPPEAGNAPVVDADVLRRGAPRALAAAITRAMAPEREARDRKAHV